jgi:DNA-binding transcriptional LysR family regulator
MNVHHLELFYYVARHGGIMPAVRHMPYGIQQPAVSGQMLQLEADLGVTLFRRRPFQLTAPGRELLEHIEPFFRDLDAVADRLRGGARHAIRLAAPDTALREHLPEVLHEVRREFPTLKVTLRLVQQEGVEPLLEAGEVDFAIAPLVGRPRAGLSHADLLEVPLALTVPRKCRFADAEALLDALAAGSWREPLIAQPATDIVPRRFREFLAGRGLEWTPSMEVETLDLVDLYVSQGFGVGLRVQVAGQARPSGVRVLPLENCPALRLAALWRGKLTPPMEALLRAVQARAQQMTTE